MRRMNFDGFERITKSRAKKNYYNGKPIYLTGMNLRPGFPWEPECKVLNDGVTDFDTMINRFEYYNGRPVMYWMNDLATGVKKFNQRIRI